MTAPRDRPAVGFCPRCATSLSNGNGFVQEYWVASETIHFCWCPSCRWRGEIKAIGRVVGVEPAEDGDFPPDLARLRLD